MTTRRLTSSLRWEMVLQFRYGFYYISAFVMAVWIALMLPIPDKSLKLVIPAFLMVNLNLVTYYYVGALALLEKGQDVLEGLVVTPLRSSEYLLSKTISLTLLGILEALGIAVIVYGVGFNWFWMLLSLLVLGGLYTFAGFIVVVRFDTMNQYLMPSALFMMILELPLLNHFGFFPSPIWYLLPTQPGFILMKAAFVPVETWQLVYGVLGSILWVGISYTLANRVFHRFVTRKAGDQ